MKVVPILMIALITVSSGCASGPTKPDKLDNKKTLNISFDKAWTKTLQTLGSEGYSIQNSSKETGSIATGKKTARLSSDEADCGSYMGIGYIGDSRTVLTISYALFLRDAGGGKTDVTVNTEIDGTYQGGNNSKLLNCFSKGKLEEALLIKLAQ